MKTKYVGLVSVVANRRVWELVKTVIIICSYDLCVKYNYQSKPRVLVTNT
jgi:hypothetical protein